MMRSEVAKPAGAMVPQAPVKRRGGREAMELFFHLLFLLCGAVAVAFVLFISIYLIVSGLPAIREIGLVGFLFGKTWESLTCQTFVTYDVAKSYLQQYINDKYEKKLVHKHKKVVFEIEP